MESSFALSLCAGVAVPAAAVLAAKPNVVLIMADDFGAECVASYGGQSYQTPNLDRLAENGIRFENMYATPVCTPSRVEIMTGRYAVRTKSNSLGDFFGRAENILPEAKLTKALETPPYWRGHEPHALREPIFGNLMRSAGYRTCVIGKWQLCYLYRYPEMPQDCGFDEHLLWSWFWRDDYPNTENPWADDSEERGDVTSRYWDAHVVENGTPKKISGQFGPDYFNRYALDFISRCAEEKQPFFLYYPMVLPHTPFVETPATRGKTDGQHDKFAGMVSYMDKLVGNVAAHLEKLGIADNTLLVFLADNGTDHRVTSLYKGFEIHGGKSRTKLSEEGNRVPLIASWPGTIPAGQVTDQMADLSDFYATLADLAGVPLPEDIVFDGYSLLPAFKGTGPTGREWTYRQIGANTCYVRNQHYRVWGSGEFDDMKHRYHARRIEHPDERERAVQNLLSAELEKIRGISAQSEPSFSSKIMQVAYWSFDEEENGHVNDQAASGANHALELKGSARIAADGKKGGALQLDGQTESLAEVVNRQDIDLSKSFTIGVWFKRMDSKSYGTLFALAPVAGWTGGSKQLSISNGRLLFGCNGWGTVKTPVSPAPEEWHHAAVVCRMDTPADGLATVTVYHNGEAVQAETSDKAWTQDKQSYRLTVGGRSSMSQHSFTGLIDEVRIYNAALNAQEITAVMDGRRITDR
jgi:arylsulfatase A